MLKMKVGFIQTLPVRGDATANLADVTRLIRSHSADLWVLPELFSTGYLFVDRTELATVAENAHDGPTAGKLADLARENGCALVAGIAEKASDGRLFNSAIAVDGNGVRGVYRKTHLFDQEKRWFDDGDSGFKVCDLAGARVGVMICFDWQFPEAARTLALAGAQIIAHPSNLVLPTCQTAMVTRALENHVFTITANRVGRESVGGVNVAFTGKSRIVGPDGAVLADGLTDRPDARIVEIDPASADDKTITGRNDRFRDRRPDLYRQEK